MKRLLKSLTLALVAVVLISSAVLAYSYSASIIVTESGSDSYGMLPIIVSVNNTYLADNNFISASGLDTRVLKSSTELPHMLADNKTLFASPISASTQEGFTYTLGNSNLTSFPIITGYGGYITTADNSSLEPGNNFTWTIDGYINTDTGTDKNLVYKSGAFRTYVSPTVSGNITASILSSATSTETLRPNAAGDEANLTGSSWSSLSDSNDATFVSTTSTSYLRDLYGLADTGIGSGGIVSVTAYFRLTTLVTDGNSIAYGKPAFKIGGTVYEGTEQSQQGIEWSTKSQAYTTSPATNSLWTWNEINSMQFGISLKTNTTYTAKCSEIYVIVTYYLDTPTLSVSATGVSSGEHTVKTIADSTNMTIYVDDVLKDSVALSGASVPNNVNNWITCSANATPYFNYISENVSGLEVLRYQPNNIIQGTVLPNRASGGDYGTITWGANPAGITVTVGGLLPVTAPVGVSEAQESTFVPSVSVDMQTTGTEGTNFPLYGLFKSLLNDFNRLRVYQDTKQSLGYEPSQAELDVAVAGSKHITMANFWKLVAVIIGWSVGTAVLLMTKNVVIGLVGYLVGFVVPTYFMSILDVWVPIVYGIGAVCLAALLWKWTSSSVG